MSDPKRIFESIGCSKEYYLIIAENGETTLEEMTDFSEKTLVDILGQSSKIGYILQKLSEYKNSPLNMLRLWLKRIGCDNYFPSFVKAGYATVEKLISIDEENLKKIVPKKVERERIQQQTVISKANSFQSEREKKYRIDALSNAFERNTKKYASAIKAFGDAIIRFQDRLPKVIRDYVEPFCLSKDKLASVLTKIEKKPIISVFGDVNAGKSSFLNCLFGRKLLPIKLKACTSMISLIQHSAKNEIKRYSQNEKGEEVLSDTIFLQNTEIPNKLIQLENENREKNLLYSRAEIFVDDEMLKWCTLVDTPGLNDKKELDKTVSKFIKESDAFIFVINATSSITDSCKELILYLREMFMKNKKLFPHCFVICNKMDAVAHEDPQELFAEVHNQFKDILPSIQRTKQEKYIFGMSAHRTLESLQTHNSPPQDYLKAVNALLSFFCESIKIQAEKALYALEEHYNFIQKHLAAVENLFKMRTVDTPKPGFLLRLLQRRDNCEKIPLHSICKKLKNDVRNFSNRLDEDISSFEKDTVDPLVQSFWKPGVMSKLQNIYRSNQVLSTHESMFIKMTSSIEFDLAEFMSMPSLLDTLQNKRNELKQRIVESEEYKKLDQLFSDLSGNEFSSPPPNRHNIISYVDVYDPMYYFNELSSDWEYNKKMIIPHFVCAVPYMLFRGIEKVTTKPSVDYFQKEASRDIRNEVMRGVCIAKKSLFNTMIKKIDQIKLACKNVAALSVDEFENLVKPVLHDNLLDQAWARVITQVILSEYAIDRKNVTITGKLYSGNNDVSLCRISTSRDEYALKISTNDPVQITREAYFLHSCRADHIIGLEHILLGDLPSGIITKRYTTTLIHVINQQVLDMKRKLRYMLEICKAVEYLHNLDISHRDIKPHNIFVDNNDHLFLADLENSQLSDYTNNSIVGTFGYAAPEIRKLMKVADTTQRYTSKVDIYSLGVTCWQIWTQKFVSSSENWVPDWKLVTNCPLVNILEQCTREDASSRPSIEDIIAAFKAIKTKK